MITPHVLNVHARAHFGTHICARVCTFKRSRGDHYIFGVLALKTAASVTEKTNTCAHRQFSQTPKHSTLLNLYGYIVDVTSRFPLMSFDRKNMFASFLLIIAITRFGRCGRFVQRSEIDDFRHEHSCRDNVRIHSATFPSKKCPGIRGCFFVL